MTDLRQPLTEIEKAELLKAINENMTPATGTALRRVFYEIERLRAAVGAALEAAEYEADTDADTIIGRGESISVIVDQLRAALSPERDDG
jgi:hypothetical protein